MRSLPLNTVETVVATITSDHKPDLMQTTRINARLMSKINSPAGRFQSKDFEQKFTLSRTYCAPSCLENGTGSVLGACPIF